MTLSLVELEEIHKDFYVPMYKILVNGQDLLRQLFLEIVSVQVDNVLKGADRFTFTVNSAFNFENRQFGAEGKVAATGAPPKERDFPLINDLFAFGNAIEISMGYQNEDKLEVMLQGKITAVSTSFPAGGLPQITVSGYDLTYCMTKGKKSRNWTNKTDSYIVSQIAREYGLNPVVEDTKVEHPKTEQSQESDWQFLEKLAERDGYELHSFKKDLFFRPPANGQRADFSLEWGRGLLTFSPEINIAEQITKVEVRGFDIKTKKEIVGTATAGDEPGREAGQRSGGEIVKLVCRDQGELKVRIPVTSQQDAKQRAEAILKKRSELFVQGSGETIGLPELRANKNIELKGLGKPFSKTYYVQQTTHTINTSGYRTTFKVKDTTV